jgi:hypothetical protein
MKRFIGLLLTGLGAVAVLWGGYHVLAGESNVQVAITDKLAITTLTSGLVGVALISLGLVWMRD